MFFRSKKILIIIAAIVLFNFFIPSLVFAAEEECPPKDGTIVLQVNIPGVTKELCSLGNAKFYTIIDANGDKKGDLTDFLALTYKFLVGIAGIAAVIMMMVGGYYWLFAGGNASKVGEAKSMISGAVLGLTLALGSYMVMNLINPDLVNWKFNPNITPPAIPKVGAATHICSSGERGYALTEAGGGAKSFQCGSVYYPRYKNFKEKCAKGKEKTPECQEAKELAHKDGCMDVLCEPSPSASLYDYACVISFDEETGELISGACRTTVNITRVEGENIRKNLPHNIDKSQTGGSCGSVSTVNVGNYDVYNNCSDNTCTVLQSNVLMPFYQSNKESESGWWNGFVAILGPAAYMLNQLGSYALTWLSSESALNDVATIYHNKTGTRLVSMSCREQLRIEMGDALPGPYTK